MAETGRLAALLKIFQKNVRDVDWGSLFNIRLLGFALNRAWVYLLFLGIGTSAMTWNGQAAPDITFMVSTIALCATLFCAAGSCPAFFFSPERCPSRNAIAISRTTTSAHRAMMIYFAVLFVFSKPHTPLYRSL